MSVDFTLKIFGITLLSWRRQVEPPPPAPELDRDALYQEFAERFERERKDAWAKDLAAQLGEAINKRLGGGH